ncbi:hypothetical protein B2J93_7958 [Marssonina coronariae]|uniref:Uncharacterized protein n=1 Tax=Diplocarpon coronariae TaxID=2795749 RepID=A0A218ZDI5_9HELO|nr:hypothetical protein B2J93_7958 [Marssonina coronariae]
MASKCRCIDRTSFALQKSADRTRSGAKTPANQPRTLASRHSQTPRRDRVSQCKTTPRSVLIPPRIECVYSPSYWWFLARYEHHDTNPRPSLRARFTPRHHEALHDLQSAAHPSVSLCLSPGAGRRRIVSQGSSRSRAKGAGGCGVQSNAE